MSKEYIPTSEEIRYLIRTSHSLFQNPESIPSVSRSGAELARIANAMPTRIGDISVCEIPGEGHKDYLTWFNLLSPAEAAALKSNNIPYTVKRHLNWNDAQNPTSPPPALKRYQAWSALAGLVDIGSMWETHELVSGIPDQAGAIGVVALAGLNVYGVGRRLHKRAKNIRAGHALEQIKDRATDASEGAIALPSFDYWSVPAQESAGDDELYAQLKKAPFTHVNADNEVSVTFCMSETVAAALRAAPRAGTAWVENVKQRAVVFSEAWQKNTELATRRMAYEKRMEFTGIEDTEALIAINREVLNNNLAVVQAAVELTELTEQWTAERKLAERVERVEKRLGEISMSGIAAPHALEMDLQQMQGMAIKSLALLPVEAEATDELVKEVRDYLLGMREVVTEPSHLRQAYEGFYKKFSDRIPGLQAWSDISHQFTQV